MAALISFLLHAEPLAVQQWDGLIAFNYSSRPFGVKRGDRSAEAKRKCPHIHLVHVETISDAGSNNSKDGRMHDRRKEKVSLERYRRASADVFSALTSFNKDIIIEKASVDEAYLDLTHAVRGLLSMPKRSSSGHSLDLGFITTETGVSVPYHEYTTTHRRISPALAAAAFITAQLREAVRAATGFTISGGVSNSKMIAKLASARNKPNKQTIVPRQSVLAMVNIYSHTRRNIIIHINLFSRLSFLSYDFRYTLLTFRYRSYLCER